MVHYCAVIIITVMGNLCEQDAMERTLRRRGCGTGCGTELMLKQFERGAHTRNVFQHSKRNFVSLRGHLISYISKPRSFVK